MSVSEQAKTILGILTRHAIEDCGPLTYADLARETGIAHCALRAPMNYLCAGLEKFQAASRERIPPLQALIVNNKTGVPGAGAWQHIGTPYVANGEAKHLTTEEQRSVIVQIHMDIASYPDWETVGQALMRIL
jgi:hypothetical protein